MHDLHEPRRTGHTPLHDVPRTSKGTLERKRLMLTVAVAFSTLVIAALYAASFMSQKALADDSGNDAPRWRVMQQDLSQLNDQATQTLGKIQQTVQAAANAQAAQQQALQSMKDKIQSASSTAQTN